MRSPTLRLSQTHISETFRLRLLSQRHPEALSCPSMITTIPAKKRMRRTSDTGCGPVMQRPYAYLPSSGTLPRNTLEPLINFSPYASCQTHSFTHLAWSHLAEEVE